jgi:ribulose-bisphosphate carboxylase large chain
MARILAKYRIESKLPLEEAAAEICKEEGVGTWTKLKTLKPEIERKYGADIAELDKKSRTAVIAYPLEEYSHDIGGIPQLLSFTAGNLFGLKALKNVRLIDVDLPRGLAKLFRGPKFGIEGVRKMTGVKERPLIGTIIKPKIGLSPKEQAEVFYQAAIGGVDFGKDDENLTNQKFCPLEERTRRIAEVIDRVEEETGRRVYYAINITTRADRILEAADIALKNGAKCLMVDVVCGGYAAVQALAENSRVKVPIHIHRAGHAAFTRDPRHGISMLVLAKLVRLAGGDQLHTGTIVGKLAGKREEVISVNNFLRSKWFGLRTTFPVASGGLHPGLVPKLIKLLGNDIIINAGGGIHGHPQGTEAGARAMRQAVDATMQGISPWRYARNHPELKAALDMWGDK